MTLPVRKLLLATILCILMNDPVKAAEPGAPSSGPLTFEWNARLRHEDVADDAFARDAQATTLRLRLGAKLRLGAGWNAFVEGEGITAADNGYNSGANGRTGFAAVEASPGL